MRKRLLQVCLAVLLVVVVALPAAAGGENSVLAMTEGSLGVEPVADDDLLCVEINRIAERRDATRTIPARDAWQTANGKLWRPHSVYLTGWRYR